MSGRDGGFLSSFPISLTEFFSFLILTYTIIHTTSINHE